MEHALAYVLSHVVAFVALTTTVSHILVRRFTRRRGLDMAIAALSSLEKFAPLIIAALAKAGDYEAGKPVVLTIPAESFTLDLTAEGLGHVTITESGALLTLTKAA